jgi:NitT/TauT family transport system ATP-binding protein
VIELRGVSHDYVSEKGAVITTTHALVDVDLAIPSLQFVSVVGPSGCGKTTLLRLLAGLLEPTAGTVLVDGAPVTGPGPERAVVFQDAGLFPWRTVRANIRLGLDLSGLAGRADADAIVERQLELMQLTEFAEQFPAQLSGGMRQRVGLARALAVAPETLLMDEPFGALDAITRRRLGAELVRLWEEDQRTVVFVTHSLDEALLLSDRTLVMRGGVILRDVEVDLPRPRDADAVLEDPAFLSLRRTLSELL